MANRLSAALLAVLVLCSLAPVATASNGAAETVQGQFEVEVSEQVHAGGRMTATFDYTIRDDQGKRTRVTF